MPPHFLANGIWVPKIGWADVNQQIRVLMSGMEYLARAIFLNLHLWKIIPKVRKFHTFGKVSQDKLQRK